MTEIAEGMINGELCSDCGVHLGGEEMDCPLLCRACARTARRGGDVVNKYGKYFINEGPIKVKKVPCPICRRFVKPAGLTDHTRDVHHGSV